jgi:hypothetical protein
MGDLVKCACGASNNKADDYCSSCGESLKLKCKICKEYHHKSFVRRKVCEYVVKKVQDDFEVKQISMKNECALKGSTVGVFIMGILIFLGIHFNLPLLIPFSFIVALIVSGYVASPHNNKAYETLVSEFRERYPAYASALDDLGLEYFYHHR